jgi:DNA modification methylase
MIQMPTEDEPVVVIEGDCLEVLRRLPVGCIHATITDPPYGVELGNTNSNTGGKHGLVREAYASGGDTYEEYVAVVPEAISECLRIARQAAVFIGPHIWELPKADAIGGVYVPSATGRHVWGFKNFLPVLLYGGMPDLHLGAKEPTAIRSTEQVKPNGHPCPKPIGWMQWLIRLSSRRGEIVLDPFGGSGTTGVAAIAEGRRAILIEKEPKYVAIARKRIAEAMGRGEGSLFLGVV